MIKEETPRRLMEPCAEFLADVPAPTSTTKPTADRPTLFRIDNDTPERRQSLANVEAREH